LPSAQHAEPQYRAKFMLQWVLACHQLRNFRAETSVRNELTVTQFPRRRLLAGAFESQTDCPGAMTFR
jgi:hypothetical protein